MELSRDEIREAYALISPYVRRTPVIDVEPGMLGSTPVVLKLEMMQVGGSFKTRGAFTNMLSRPVPAAGVVAPSGGNHGVAVAYVANRLGIPAKIFVPTLSSPAKVARIRELGADLVVSGARYADAYEAARRWEATSGALGVHGYDQRETILGQATVGLEFSEQAASLDTVLAPVGGGGLIAGVASYFTTDVTVIGVEPDGAPTLFSAREAGQIVDAPVDSIAADALGARRVGELVFPITQKYVATTVLVSDDDIRSAQRLLWHSLRLATEPAAAVGVAALLTGAYRPGPGERVGVVISGANTSKLPE